MTPRVIGIDPGTVSFDICGLEDGRVFLDVSLPTADVVRDPSLLLARIQDAAPLDLVAGPSGFGLPLVAARDVTEAELRLAALAPPGEPGGIGGLRSLMRALAALPVPVVFTPGVVHLATVPAFRKVNRVDMGTADKVCAAACALADLWRRRGLAPAAVSCILLELGGAFTAALAIERGRIVDGLGGTSGPLGLRAAGALDGEVAFLAGSVSKAMLFTGGAAAVAAEHDLTPEALAAGGTAERRQALDAYVEGAAKAVAALRVAVPDVRDVIVSGRVARVPQIRDALFERLAPIMDGLSLHVLEGFAARAKQAAQGAAVMADGLAGGRFAPIVDSLGLRGAGGTVLDHLYVVSRDAARRRIGLDDTPSAL